MILAGALVVGLSGAGAASAQEIDCGPEPSPPCVSPTTVQVKGNVVLPRTGSDVDAQVLAGAGLTAAGLAFAVTARKRRQRFDSAATV